MAWKIEGNGWRDEEKMKIERFERRRRKKKMWGEKNDD